MAPARLGGEGLTQKLHKYLLELPNSGCASQSLQSTQWSKSTCSLHSTQHHAQLLFKGLHNYGMRLVANGKFVQVEICKSLDEHYLVNTLCKIARQRGHNDPALYMDKIATSYAQSHGLPAPPAEQSSAERTNVWHGIANELYDHMLDIAGINTGRASRAQELKRTHDAEVARLNHEIDTLKRQLQDSREPPLPPRAQAMSIDEALAKVRYNVTAGHTQQFAETAVKGTKSGEVKTQVRKLNLSAPQMAKVDELASCITKHVSATTLSKPAKDALQSKLENYLVEWGVSARVVSKNTEYAGVARLLAAAAVASE